MAVKRRLSEAGRAAISKAARKRWRGYGKLTPREKRKVLGVGREPKMKRKRRA